MKESLMLNNIPIELSVDKKKIVEELRKASQTFPQGMEEINKETYYNPNVASLLKFAGEEVILPNGELLSKTSIGDLNRNALVTGQKAQHILMLIFDRSAFYKNFTILYGDELTIPMDIYTDIPEQLTSTIRMGRQLDKDEELDLMNIIGQELFVRHVERQYDIPIALLRNFLYRPDFENIIDTIIANALANDFLRLATNGYTDTYGASSPGAGTIKTSLLQQHFYTLHIGHEKLLKTAKGSWTNSNGDAIFCGKHGIHLTPNKIDVDAVRVLKVWEDLVAANLSAEYTASGVTIANSSGKVRVTAATTGYAQWTPLVEVKPFTRYKAIVTIQSEETGKGRFQVLSPDEKILAQTAEHTAHGAASTYSITFFTGPYTYIFIRLTSTVDTKYMDFSDMTITRAEEGYTGNDIIDIFTNILRTHRDDYKEENNVFVVSYADFEKYSEARANPTAFVNGQVVGVNNTMRESWMTTGETPNFRGKRIVVNPYKKAVDELTPEGSPHYGNIYYGPLDNLLIGAQKKIEINRNYNSRFRKGGSAIEHTHHYWIDYGVKNYEAFSIAFKGAKCENPVISNDNVGKGASTTAVTSGADVYAYCDTPGARLFYVIVGNTALLDDYDTALANLGTAIATDVLEVVPNVKPTYSTTNNLIFRAFKNGYLQPSDKVTLTVS